MDNAYTCGCHLNHQSQSEHDQFWDGYRRRHADNAGRQAKTMPFGKFKGQPISSLPKWYLDWIVKNMQLKPWLKKEIDKARGNNPKNSTPKASHDSVELVGRDYVKSDDTSCPFDCE